ncbi:MAG TPA: substrate-binding domain-containing protein [Chloroflexota bacterium]
MAHHVRRILVIFVALATIVAAVAVSAGTRPVSAQHATRVHSARAVHALRMEVIVKTSNSPYWQLVFAAARHAAQQFGITSLGYVGGPSEADINAEITLIENAIAKHPDFLVIAPTNATALDPAITKAYNAGIKVIIIDSSATTPNFQSFLGTDNQVGGCLAAQTLARAIKKKTGRAAGQIAYATFQSGAGSLTARDAGFTRCIAAYPNIHIVAHKDAGGDPNVGGKPLSIAADTLTAFPKLVGYWGDNLNTLQGAEKAFQERRVNMNKVSLVGYDNTAQEVTALRQHKLDGTVLQDPYQMGYGGVAYGVIASAGLNVPRFLNTGAHVATPANVNSPIIQGLLDPLHKRGLGF